MDIRGHNRKAWDKSVEEQDEWTMPVGTQEIEAARRGEWQIYLTRSKPVPREWLPVDMTGVRVLCLAGGGGQQGPILAAAGAVVTVFDNSPRQLAQDRMVAEREGLSLETREGDMADLSMFADGQFELVIHPVSNLFVPDIRPVWREVYRVTKSCGSLAAGFMNPAFYLFDRRLMDEQGVFQVRHALPYSDLTSIPPDETDEIMQEGWPLEFGHTLTDQINGQLEAGFTLNGLYEDYDLRNPLYRYMPIHIATWAIKT